MNATKETPRSRWCHVGYRAQAIWVRPCSYFYSVPVR